MREPGVALLELRDEVLGSHGARDTATLLLDARGEGSAGSGALPERMEVIVVNAEGVAVGSELEEAAAGFPDGVPFALRSCANFFVFAVEPVVAEVAEAVDVGAVVVSADAHGSVVWCVHCGE